MSCADRKFASIKQTDKKKYFFIIISCFSQVVEVEVIEDRGEEVVEFLAFLGGFGGVVGRQRGVEGDGGEGLLVGEAYVVAEL